MSRRRHALRAVLALACAVLALSRGAEVRAQRLDYTPAELEGIEIVDRAGNPVPGDVRLVDESGAEVRLGDFLGHGRPVILQLVYSECPMLCNLVINGYLDGAKELDWSPGTEYEVLSISFNPRETCELAALKKKNYLAALDRPGAEAGWHFLTGEEAEVRRIAESVGFPYRWIEKSKQYAHGAGIFVLTPDGRVSRTLYGIQFPGKDLRFALMEASEGKLGSPLQHIALYCFTYNAAAGGYVVTALTIMKIGGALTVLVLGLFVGALWYRDRRRHVPRHA